MTRIEIDLNVRVRGNGTYAGFEDVTGPLVVGGKVEVYESESGLAGTGRITEIDPEREAVYLSVDWGSLHQQEDEPDETVTASGWSSGCLMFSQFRVRFDPAFVLAQDLVLTSPAFVAPTVWAEPSESGLKLTQVEAVQESTVAA